MRCSAATPTARAAGSRAAGLAPDYIVYASDYESAGTLELEAGDRDAARAIWRRGAGIYPRHDVLRALLREHFGEAGPAGSPRIARVSEQEVGARRIPVRTPFITARTGLDAVIDEATADVREPGDVLVLAESAAAAGQGKIVPLELVEAGPMARVLSRFVGAIGPLHSPEGMQGAISRPAACGWRWRRSRARWASSLAGAAGSTASRAPRQR